MDKALQTMINNMPDKTGKSLDEWKKLLSTNPFEKHGEAVKFLKVNHNVTHGFANTIVSLFRDSNNPPPDLVEAQYKGKESLRPIYEKLISSVEKFGQDVIMTPKKGSVSIIRKRQFALIKPATKTRIDLGLKLKGIPTTNRLGDSGSFGAMCTHRVQLTRLDEIDEELIAWLREAYQKAD